jgi:alkylation response protein AidB-like acyl-CoA dehydrogenase
MEAMVNSEERPRQAERLADEVLFPAANAVDLADRIPPEHLDLLAREGYYGLAAAGPYDIRIAGAMVETFASGCLATTFVWIQHHGAVIAAASSERPGIAERWLEPLTRGELRGGIALAGVRPGTERLRVRATDDGYVLDGHVPWVTGWDMIDVLHLAAVDENDIVHFLLVDARESATLAVRPLQLVAVQASRTVNVAFDGHLVPADRLASTRPYPEWAASEAAGSALNGFLALGLVRRCDRLLDGEPFAAELAACREALMTADAAAVPAARAAASELALRATARLAVHTGSRSVLRDHHAQRLIREAAFLLVFGTRPGIRDALLARLGPRAIDGRE